MTGEDDPLIRQARALPKDIAPEHDLWPGIAGRLDQRAHPPASDAPSGRPLAHRWQRLLALAASLLLATILGFWIGNGADEDRPAATIQAAAPAGPRAAVLTSADALQQTRRALAASVRGRLETLPPATRKVVVANLAAINKAMDEIDAALTTAPDSGLDGQLLLSMYVDQLTLLNTMNNTLPRTSTEITL
jgi:hypothetical protein